MTTTHASAYDIAATLYRSDPDYPARVVAFCAELGWELHPNQWRRCVTLLTNPAHRCSSPRCLSERTVHEGSDRFGMNIDHVIVLRRGPASRPTQWAYLSQPYSDSDPGGRALRLGDAPYGAGTTALLYVGRPLKP